MSVAEGQGQVWELKIQANHCASMEVLCQMVLTVDNRWTDTQCLPIHWLNDNYHFNTSNWNFFSENQANNNALYKYPKHSQQ